MSDAPWRPVLRRELLDAIPCGVVVIDRSLTVVETNATFASVFGEVRGLPCYTATRQRTTPCPDCSAVKTFVDGQRRTRELSGVDSAGRPAHYLMQISPVHDERGEVSFIAAVTTDLSATKRLQREYQTLFEKVPCYVTVINRDFRVVKANEMFRRVFGDSTGEHCYELFKRRSAPCSECPAELTFRDGGTHTSEHVGLSLADRPTHYAVSTSPLIRNDGETTHVIEMAVDITEAHRLEEALSRANALRQVLVEHAPYAIVILGKGRRVELANRAAEALWGVDRGRFVGHRLPARSLSVPVERLMGGNGDDVALTDTTIVHSSGEEVPVRIAALRLPAEPTPMGAALIVQDLRELRQLEREKLDAERLAAVGQTVAGLAHGIKNILTGLEGGMYVTSTGLAKKDQQRVAKGWSMLERNIGRVSGLVKNLLAFSRGDAARPVMTDPAAVVREVVELFREHAEQHGISLVTDIAPVTAASLDPEGIHTCLTNLVSNAVDACLVSNNPGCRIAVGVREEDDVLVFEVADSGCGMDYEVKRKAFTSFFTTKGAGGTGLGLLLTRKIVQQHGGSVSFESSPDQGTVFRLRFPRRRLPPPLPRPVSGEIHDVH